MNELFWAGFEKLAGDKIKGGLADDVDPKALDAKALNEGRKVEMEHTSDKAVAKEIAMDHLVEDAKYYDKLKRIEKRASKRRNVAGSDLLMRIMRNLPIKIRGFSLKGQSKTRLGKELRKK